MKQDLLASLRAAVVSLLAFTVICGLAYPALVLGAATVFPDRTRELVGQPFDDPRYFWSRPSATAPYPYNPMASTGTNLGMTDAKGRNAALHDAVTERIKALRAADPGNDAPVPADLVTSSASGLDPHITPAAAHYQASRVARVRGLPVDEVRRLIEDHTEGRQLGILGEPRVNVPAINRALDARTAPSR